MPNRILKESICTSESIDQLSWFEEVLFYRLIVKCDDFGRFDGRVAVIKNLLLPLKENITTKNVMAAIEKLARVGLVTLYEVDGKPFLFLPTWNEHQIVRAKKSKFPAPESKCMQMHADECKCFRNPIQSNPNPIQSEECAEQTPGVSSAPPAIVLPLVDKTEYPITVEQCQEWAGLYPAVDVIQQLRAMRGWLEANPKNRKTKSGILRFVNGWLSKEQNRARASAPSQPAESQQRMRKLKPRMDEAVPPPSGFASALKPAEKKETRAVLDERASAERMAAALRALEGVSE